MFKNYQDPITQGYWLLVDFGSCINNKCTEQEGEKRAGLAQNTEDLVSDPRSASWLPAQQRLHNEHCGVPITVSLFIHLVKLDCFTGQAIFLVSFTLKLMQSDKTSIAIQVIY